jgi:hypothetical protein
MRERANKGYLILEVFIMMRKEEKKKRRKEEKISTFTIRRQLCGSAEASADRRAISGVCVCVITRHH